MCENWKYKNKSILYKTQHIKHIALKKQKHIYIYIYTHTHTHILLVKFLNSKIFNVFLKNSLLLTKPAFTVFDPKIQQKQ